MERGILDGYIQFEALEASKIGILDIRVDGQLFFETKLIGDGEAFDSGDGLPKAEVVEFG